MNKWGIDLGGTKIECVVLNSENEVLFRDRVPTEQAHGYGHILGQIQKVLNMAKTRTGHSPEFVGICTPGAIDAETGLLKNSNTVVLNGKPFKNDLEQLLNVSLGFENDANCFALAEYHMGAVAQTVPDAACVFGIILGTGVGGGVVVNGQLLSGRHGIAGEWGHNFLDESGGPCYCGKTGCVETVISGPALERFYRNISGGDDRKLKDILARARTGENEAAVRTLNRLLHFFGYGISWIVNILDPDAIIIGGGVGNTPELYSRGHEFSLPWVFNPHMHTRLLKPALGDSAGVFGAAFLSPKPIYDEREIHTGP